MADDWRIQFNNYVQKNGLISQVAWSQPLQTGPQNSPTWTASVFVNAIEYGRGSAANLGGAREIAAEMALRALSMQFDNFKAYAERNGLMPYVFFSRPVQTKAQGQEPITPTWSTSVFNLG
ncbi:hypothetical protein L226DRAFT_532869 [Lentinus tigrinus ALCF2SS1-7]|uniref:uncharacterized protein n=1 Tax=Lentinus tigrinus ALCF2SS1-7 TaxID=1328758 RepID=UPI001165E6A6|nr:hypothetical protein L226DRAFT_532869 [Lentinus tigrinus ALCF2SS1-7]